jgi:hypothetical protein
VVYEGVRLNGGGCGHNHSVTDMNNGCETKGLCGLATKTTDTAIKVRFHQCEFQVLEPGTIIVVNGERYMIDAFHRTIVRFSTKGKATVTMVPGN